MTMRFDDDHEAQLAAGVKTATLVLMLALIVDLADPSLLAATPVTDVDATPAAPPTILVTVPDYFPAHYPAPAGPADAAQPQAF